ncbi:MAG: cytochrome c biogenesis protein CcdA [Gammaproteobacteria bacterium]|nr:cytochrome c biogenesis protein CcdA [Gammaproteobacteria bacterium]
MDANSVTTPLAFIAGTLSFLSPCVLPLVPVYISYLSGNAVEGDAELRRGHVLVHALCFVGGFTAIFMLLFGLPATYLGEALNQYSESIARLGGLLVFVFGLHTFGLITIPALNMTRRLEIAPGANPGYVRSGLIGIAFAAGWTPCIGPLLGAVISMAFTQPSAGLFFTFVYAMGLALPFLLTALLITRTSEFIRRLNRHARVVQRVSGAFLVAVGVLLVTEQFTVMNSLFIRLTPDWLVERL